MFLVPILTILLALTQQHEIQTHPEDTLHHFAILDVGDDPVTIEAKAEHEGYLHVCASSKDMDPRLSVVRKEGEEILEDDNSGGGTTAYLEFKVHAGDVAELIVATTTVEEDDECKIELHWIASVETEVTRSAATEALGRIKEAEALVTKEDHEGARKILDRALSKLMGVEGSKLSHEIGEANSDLGSSAYQLEWLPTSYTFFKAAYEHSMRILPKDHPKLLDTKMNLALLLQKTGDIKNACTLQEAVIEAYERILPEDHSNLLLAKQNLAITKSQMGDLSGACVLFEEVLEGRSRNLPEDHPKLLAAKGNLAATMFRLGNLFGARALMEAVLEAYHRVLPEGHPHLQSVKNNLAAVIGALGDLPGALALQEAVLEARSRILPEFHPDLLSTKQNIAITMMKMGDLPGACALFEAVLETRSRILSEDHPHLITAKHNLAITISQMGNFSGALALQEAVLEAQGQIYPKAHPELLLSKANIANTMREMGDIQGARALYEAVLEAQNRILPEDHPALISTKAHLAATMSEMGDLSEARKLEETVLEVYRHVLPEDHPHLLIAKQNLAFTMHTMGDFSDASALAHELAGNLLSRCLWAAASLSAREAREIVAGELIRNSLSRFFTSSEKSASERSLRFDLAETFRSVASLDLGSSLHLDPEIIQLRRQVADIRAQLGDYLGTGSTEESFEESLSELVRERDKLERELHKELRQRGIFLDGIRSVDVASVLPEGTVAIGFAQIKGWELDSGSGRILSRGEVLAAHLLNRDGALIEVELSSAAELEELAAAWREALGEPIGRGIMLESTEEREKQDEYVAGTALRSRLLDPLFAELGDETDTLLICVDDFVHTIPLDALPLGEDRVGDIVEIVYLPSFRSLVSPRPPLDASTEPRLLAIGGIDFDAEGDEQTGETATALSAAIETNERSGNGAANFSTIPQTQHEAAAVKALFKQTFEQEGALLSGAEATKAAFTQFAPGNCYLHIATHGWFAPMQFPESGEDATVFSKLLYGRASLASLTYDSRGLAFAGANRGRNELGRVPGILTAEELAGIDLSACELAVLSACETNVGIRSAGVGIQSLKAALHAAGVRTAITSLWKVDDAATRKLMELFYTYLWVDKMPKAKALWKAKMVLREEDHPVRDWAAWVLSGYAE